MRATKDDAKVATYHARGFGIEDEDIIYIEDMTITEIDKIVMEIKKSFLELANKRKRSFLYVYVAGHGCVDNQKQLLTLNGTSGNLYAIEDVCREISRYTKNMCTVFAVYDVCKSSIADYPELSRKIVERRS